MYSKLIKEDKVIHEFPLQMQEVREFKDRYIIVLDVPMDKIFNENVFCVSKEGKLLWQIEEKKLPRKRSHYIGTDYYKKDLLVIFNVDSCAMEVDIETGKILRTEFSK